MSDKDDRAKIKPETSAMDRRKVLLGSTTLAASALAAGTSTRIAEAQRGAHIEGK